MYSYLVTLKIRNVDSLIGVRSMLQHEIKNCINIKGRAQKIRTKLALETVLSELNKYDHIPENGIVIQCIDQTVTISEIPEDKVTETLYLIESN